MTETRADYGLVLKRKESEMNSSNTFIVTCASCGQKMTIHIHSDSSTMLTKEEMQQVNQECNNYNRSQDTEYQE